MSMPTPLGMVGKRALRSLSGSTRGVPRQRSPTCCAQVIHASQRSFGTLWVDADLKLTRFVHDLDMINELEAMEA